MKETITTKYPFATCPRQVAIPERIGCYSQIQFFRELNRFNGIKRKVYYSIYQTNNYNNFDDVIIDCIAFDLDSEKSLENLRKFYEYCEKHNYQCLLMFSTGGFWAFIKTTKIKLQHPKIALGEAQRKIAKDIRLTIGHSKEADIDQSIIGDIARITRAINTKDIARKRFCINLTNKEIYLTHEEICQIAQQPRFQYYIYGEKGYDMTPHDKNTPTYEEQQLDIKLDMNIKVETDIENFLPCVKSWLVIPKKGVYIARYYFVTYTNNIGIPPTKCDELAQKYFGKAPRTDNLRNNYNHFKKDGTLKKGYHKDKVFPKCSTLICKGLCPFKCKFYSSNNSPIYYQGD